MTTIPKSPESDDPYERLMSEMPRIADVVNAFSSETVQKSAFDALVSAIGTPTAPVLHAVDKPVDRVDPVTITADERDQGDETKSRRKRSRSTSGKKAFSPTKGLNFAPVGKPTLAAFIAEKAPRNQHERNLTACYYLAEMMGEESIDVNHVLAVYRAAGWSAATQPDTSLQKTASYHSWLDTSDMSNIKVVWLGTDFIETKMPVDQAKKDAA